VSADRALRERAKALGAQVAKPGWLIDLLDQEPGEVSGCSPPPNA
jgi:hypothetical protein